MRGSGAGRSPINPIQEYPYRSSLHSRAVEVTKTPKRPRDPNVLAKTIVGIASGEIEEAYRPKKDEAAAALGRKGGQARAKSMTSKQRAEIARKAAQKRWRQP